VTPPLVAVDALPHRDDDAHRRWRGRALVLLYGLPVTRIVELRIERVTRIAGQHRLQFGAH
jgi:hypothetical protein